MGPDIETLDLIAKSAGFASAILVVVTTVFYRLYQSERAERREAWKAISELTANSTKALINATVLLEVIKNDISHKKD